MKMLAAVARFLVAAAAAVVLILLVIWTTTGRWPSTVTVRNTLDDAQCTLAFSDGWTWNVVLKQGEQKNWFFLLGRPASVEAACTTGGREVRHRHAFCEHEKKLVVTIGEIESETPDPSFCPR